MLDPFSGFLVSNAGFQEGATEGPLGPSTRLPRPGDGNSSAAPVPGAGVSSSPMLVPFSWDLVSDAGSQLEGTAEGPLGPSPRLPNRATDLALCRPVTGTGPGPTRLEGHLCGFEKRK